MPEEQSIETAMWVMVLVQTISAVDLPGKGPRKLPSPRAYLPIIVGFSLIQIVADTVSLKAAKAMAWVVVVSAATLGPFGMIFANFLNSVASFAAGSSPSNTTGSTTP